MAHRSKTSGRPASTGPTSEPGLGSPVTAHDRHGRPVRVGTRVRVLEIAEALRDSLPPEEWPELQTMLGEVFEVYEIDEYGSAWVEKEWLTDDGDVSHSHSLALDSHEMEVV